MRSFYRSPNTITAIKSRRLRWEDDLSKMEEDRSAFKIIKHKPTGKRPVGRPRGICEYSIRMNVKGIGVNMRNLVDSLQDRFVGEPLYCKWDCELPSSIRHGVN